MGTGVYYVETLPSEQTEFPYDDIVIIDTEEDFFEEYGSWPLKRKDIAKMVVNLKRLGAEVIALDMLMDFPNGYGEDPILAKALKESGKTMVVSQLQFGESESIYSSVGEFKGVNSATDVLDEATLSVYSNITLIGSKISLLRFYPEFL